MTFRVPPLTPKEKIACGHYEKTRGLMLLKGVIFKFIRQPCNSRRKVGLSE